MDDFDYALNHIQFNEDMNGVSDIPLLSSDFKHFMIHRIPHSIEAEMMGVYIIQSVQNTSPKQFYFYSEAVYV